MIKDPLHKKETPYDILDVTPYADHNEVHQALPKIMRDRKRLAKCGFGVAQEAQRKLKNPKERIDIDIFFYSGGEMPEDIKDEKPLDINIDAFLIVPTIKEDEIYTDLDKTDFTDECSEILFNKTKLSELSKYNQQIYKFEIILDK